MVVTELRTKPSYLHFLEEIRSSFFRQSVSDVHADLHPACCRFVHQSVCQVLQLAVVAAIGSMSSVKRRLHGEPRTDGYECVYKSRKRLCLQSSKVSVGCDPRMSFVRITHFPSVCLAG